jgi:O-methyltransferase
MDRLNQIYAKYQNYTMLSPEFYINNLILAGLFQHVKGAVVECGTWRGGMIAGIAELLQEDRDYYLFDSFEGLPPAQEIDGEGALRWQQDTQSPYYFNNCRADETWARKAMQLSGAKHVYIHKGWFSSTLKNFDPAVKISILRLDGDWYESTIECLERLYPFVVSEGLIIIDDYYAWDGCSRAVHDYLSKYKLIDRIYQFEHQIAYIIKRGESVALNG